MMYDEDDDAPPTPRDWMDIGWYNVGWREEPPADCIVGESPKEYTRRTGRAPIPSEGNRNA